MSFHFLADGKKSENIEGLILFMLKVCIIRPHRRNAMHRCVACARQFVCLSVKRSRAKTAEPIVNRFGMYLGSGNRALDGIQIPRGKGQYSAEAICGSPL